jgi:hypothetical protein
VEKAHFNRVPCHSWRVHAYPFEVPVINTLNRNNL